MSVKIRTIKSHFELFSNNLGRNNLLMSESQDKIQPFEYICCREVTQRMKEITKTKGLKSLGGTLGNTERTISTVHQRDANSFLSDNDSSFEV